MTGNFAGRKAVVGGGSKKDWKKVSMRSLCIKHNCEIASKYTESIPSVN